MSNYRGVVPSDDQTDSFGVATLRWLKGWFKDLYCSGSLTDGTNSVTVANTATAIAASHARQHAVTSTSDHTSTATAGNILKADANGLPVDASNTDAQVSSAVSASHSRQHSITSTSDHTSAATSGQILKADANGLPVDATNTDAQVSDAVTKAHTHDFDLQQVNSTSSTATTSTNYVDIPSFSFTTKTGGTRWYDIDCSLEHANSQGDRVHSFALLIDGSIVLERTADVASVFLGGALSRNLMAFSWLAEIAPNKVVKVQMKTNNNTLTVYRRTLSGKGYL